MFLFLLCVKRFACKIGSYCVCVCKIEYQDQNRRLVSHAALECSINYDVRGFGFSWGKARVPLLWCNGLCLLWTSSCWGVWVSFCFWVLLMFFLFSFFFLFLCLFCIFPVRFLYISLLTYQKKKKNILALKNSSNIMFVIVFSSIILFHNNQSQIRLRSWKCLGLCWSVL